MPWEAIKAMTRKELAKEASKRLDEIQARAKKVPMEVLVRWLREERR